MWEINCDPSEVATVVAEKAFSLMCIVYVRYIALVCHIMKNMVLLRKFLSGAAAWKLQFEEKLSTCLNSCTNLYNFFLSIVIYYIDNNDNSKNT